LFYPKIRSYEGSGSSINIISDVAIPVVSLFDILQYPNLGLNLVALASHISFEKQALPTSPFFI